jgi:hypothetical protein
MMGRIYGPKLRALGFDPAAGLYAREPTDTQETRRKLVDLLSNEAADAATNAKLVAAAKSYLAGDPKAWIRGSWRRPSPPMSRTAVCRPGRC